MNKDKILNNINALSQNTMFNLSLTSKELFHSNFWAWIIRKYPNIFACAFDFQYDKGNRFEICREKHHFDLCIETEDTLIIIENKLKSFPNKNQLEEYGKYNTDLQKKLFLISYFKPLFKIDDGAWECLTYKELCNRIKNCFISAKDSAFQDDDRTIIKNYIEFLELLVKLQDNIEITKGDKICNIWNIVKDSDIQEKLNKINLTKTFERIVSAKLTELVLDKFAFSDYIDEIRIDCGRDLKIFSDILFYFPGAWDNDENKRQDLCYLGISLWENYYRYYAGLHKAQCRIYLPKHGRYDKENKHLGFKYLSDNYGWLFNQEQGGIWNGYSYKNEMYLYKKTDISNYTISELSQKVQYDLSLIYNYIKDFC